MHSNILLSLFYSVQIAIFSYLLHFLNKSGAIAIFVTAFIVFYSGSWQTVTPILTFFVLSSLLSKINKRFSKVIIRNNKDVRNWIQVLANGGAAFLICLLVIVKIVPGFNSVNDSLLQYIYIMFASAIAAVCADTWGTEIGTMFKVPTYDIGTVKRVPQGISGGVSFIGIFASALGAFTIAYSASYFIFINTALSMVIITIAGFSGGIVDSIVGKHYQAKYICPECNSITEEKFHCNSETNLIKGVLFINNDIVNLVTGITGAIAAYFLIQYFQ